jgi:GDP-4-dehydro-6-deoxy-D-mannose reductase
MGVCLITGIGGFLGSHLADFLLTQGWEVTGILRQDSSNVAHIRHGLALFHCDILDKAQIESVVREVRPEAIFHLAAQSLPSRSWQEPEATFQVNVLGTLNLLGAVRAAELDPVVVVAGSSAEYGPSMPEEIPIKEDAPLRPASPYGVSKAATTLLALQYHRAFGMKVVVARPFFVIGPRKSGDACSDFARGVVAVERAYVGCRMSDVGQLSTLNPRPSTGLQVGNLEAVRDLLDVEDAVRALWLLLQRGVS